MSSCGNTVLDAGVDSALVVCVRCSDGCELYVVVCVGCSDGCGPCVVFKSATGFVEACF